jgi:predicted dehydrogenase
VDGRILVEDLNAGDLILRTSQGEKQERHPPAENLHSPLIADFVSSIAEKRPPMITGEIGSMTNEIMQQAYLDARD